MELIGKEALKRRFENYMRDCEEAEDTVAARVFADCICELDDSTTVEAVPVVRCKECKRSKITEFGKRYCSEPLGMYACFSVKDDNFCSHGKRKEVTE